MDHLSRIISLYDTFKSGNGLSAADISYLSTLLTASLPISTRTTLVAFLRVLISSSTIALTPELTALLSASMRAVHADAAGTAVDLDGPSYCHDMQEIVVSIFIENARLPYVRRELDRLARCVGFDRIGISLVFMTDVEPANHLLRALRQLREDDELVMAIQAGKREMSRVHLRMLYRSLRERILARPSRTYMTCIAEINEVLRIADTDMVGIAFELTEEHLRYMRCFCVDAKTAVHVHAVLEQHNVIRDAVYGMEQTVETGKSMLPADLRLLEQILLILERITAADACAESRHAELMTGALFAPFTNAIKGTVLRILACYDDEDVQRMVIGKIVENVGMLYTVYGEEDSNYHFVRGLVHFIKRCVDRHARTDIGIDTDTYDIVTADDNNRNSNGYRNSNRIDGNNRNSNNINDNDIGNTYTIPITDNITNYDTDNITNYDTNDTNTNTAIISNNDKLVTFIIFTVRTECTAIVRDVLHILTHISPRRVYSKLLREEEHLKRVLGRDPLINALLTGIFTRVGREHLRTFSLGLLARMLAVPCRMFFAFFGQFDFHVITHFLNDDLLEQIVANKKDGIRFLMRYADEMSVCLFVERHVATLASLEERDVIVLIDRVMDRVNIRDVCSVVGGMRMCRHVGEYYSIVSKKMVYDHADGACSDTCSSTGHMGSTGNTYSSGNMDRTSGSIGNGHMDRTSGSVGNGHMDSNTDRVTGHGNMNRTSGSIGNGHMANTYNNMDSNVSNTDRVGNGHMANTYSSGNVSNTDRVGNGNMDSAGMSSTGEGCAGRYVAVVDTPVVEVMNDNAKRHYCMLLKTMLVLGMDISAYVTALVPYTSVYIDDMITFYYVCTGNDMRETGSIVYRAMSRRDNSLFVLHYDESDMFTRYVLFNALEERVDDRVKEIVVRQITDILAGERVDEPGMRVLRMCLLTLMRCRNIDDAVMVLDNCAVEEVRDMVRMVVKKNMAEGGTCYVKVDEDDDMRYLLGRQAQC